VKVSGFSFLRNGQALGYPFEASIRSVLPLVDEFIVALGPCNDETELMLRAIGDPKIRIIRTQWNENIRADYSVKGFVYGQQKSIALFNCTGDWAFYLEADEVLHECDVPKIRATMERCIDDERVEALAFDYLHFYGNKNTVAWSPRWYRSEVRIVRNTIPVWASEGLFFNVLMSHKRSRYPRAMHTGATIHHYGWVRSQAEMNARDAAITKFWGGAWKPKNYPDVDPATLKPFVGTHPKVIQSWLPPAEGLFQANPLHKLTARERKHRVLLKLESWFGLRFNKKHYTLVR
jgi:glycosyltransferase involved in cell wall biosynthesis